MEIRIPEYLKVQRGGRIQIPKARLKEYNIEKGDLVWIGRGELIKEKRKEEGEK